MEKSKFKRKASIYSMLSKIEQMKLYGGWFSYGGYFYFTQSELVDILGSSSDIPNEYQRSYAVTNHNDNYTVVELTNYYVLTQQQYEELMAGPLASEFDSSEHSFPSGSSSMPSGSSSNGAGVVPENMAVLPEPMESDAIFLATTIFNIVISWSQYASATTYQRNLIRRRIRSEVFSAYCQTYFMDQINFFSGNYTIYDHFLELYLTSADHLYTHTYLFNLGNLLP